MMTHWSKGIVSIDSHKGHLFLPVFFALAGSLAVAIYHKPLPTFDSVAYMVWAESSSERVPPERAHDLVYALLQRSIPKEQYELLVKGNSYRADLAANPWHFDEQIPFYSIRVAYVSLISLIHRFGLNVFQAIRLVSSFSFLCLCLVVFSWVRSKFADSSFGDSLMFAACPPVVGCGRLLTPDGLSSAITVGSLYLLFARRSLLGGVLLLLVSLYVRTDNLLLLLAVVYYLASLSRTLRMRRCDALVTAGLGVCSVAFLIMYPVIIAGRCCYTTL